MKFINYRNIHKLIIVSILLLTAIVISIIAYKVLEVKPDTRTVETHKSLTSKELFAGLQSRSSGDLIDYIEKAIEVEGVVKEINHRDNLYTILLEGDNYNRQIICEMQPDQNFEILKLKIGDKIIVKGILKGFLMDAILLNCIIAQ